MNKLQHYIEFIPGMQQWFSIRKSSNMIHHTKYNEQIHKITTKEAEKALNKIQHPFLILKISI